jgi:hypothetical protein
MRGKHLCQCGLAAAYITCYRNMHINIFLFEQFLTNIQQN